MDRPETRFVSLGRDRLAYQAFGDGPTDLLHIKPLCGSVDSIWEHAGHLRIWRTTRPHLRLIVFDHRGTGVSDAQPEETLGNLDDRVADALAVLDDLGVGRVALCGEGDGALAAVKLAAEHPDRVDKLMLVNGFAKGSGGDGYDLAPPLEVIEQQAEAVRLIWGTGMATAAVAPSLADDLSFAARFERSGARPRAASAWLRNQARADVRPLLDLVRAPTLVIYSGDINNATVEQSRHLGESIPGARVLDRSSSSFYWGDGVVEEMISFISGAQSAGDRELATLLFTDVVDSTGRVIETGDHRWRQTLDFLDELVEDRVTRWAGRVVKQTGDGHLLEFSMPRDAVEVAMALSRDVGTLGVALRAGVHTGEVERRENGDLGGLTVHIAARVAAIAAPGQVVVSRTVADLLGAGDYTLLDLGEHDLKGVPGRWAIFSVSPS
jgi:class 3 adenylate cyclase/pimeloyl-ACP methyl ester carboxylesterase